MGRGVSACTVLLLIALGVVPGFAAHLHAPSQAVPLAGVHPMGHLSPQWSPLTAPPGHARNGTAASMRSGRMGPIIAPNVRPRIRVRPLGPQYLDQAKWTAELRVSPQFVLEATSRRPQHRERILAEIHDNPGIRYRELLRRTDCANGTLSYHLHRLERTKLIRSDEQDGRRVFFPQMTVVSRASRPLGGTAGRILDHVRRNPGRTTQEVAECLGLLQSDASYHLHNLHSMGSLQPTRTGRSVHWYPLGTR